MLSDTDLIGKDRERHKGVPPLVLTITNATSSSSPKAMRPRVLVLPQPHPWALISVYTIASRPMARQANPRTSKGPTLLSRGLT